MTNELDIRCSDQECRGRNEDIGARLLKGKNGFYCPYCRNFRFHLLRRDPEPPRPTKCWKCGNVGNNEHGLCDDCITAGVKEFEKKEE